MKRIGDGDLWEEEEGAYLIYVRACAAIVNGVPVSGGNGPYRYETEILPPGAKPDSGRVHGPYSAQGDDWPTKEDARDKGFAAARERIKRGDYGT